jgi:flagellar biosynthetic protein FlhB
VADLEDRTEAASGRRLQKAREEGNVPVSREVAAAAVLAAFTIGLVTLGPSIGRNASAQLAVFLGQSHRINVSEAIPMAGRSIVVMAAPFIFAALLAGSASVLLQTGFLLNARATMPDLARISPGRGLKRLFGSEILIETSKSLIKLVLAGCIGWHALAIALESAQQAFWWEAGVLADATTRAVIHILLAMIAVQIALAGLDVLRARLHHARSLRMSRQDLRDEHKESDGDPQIKARIRKIRQYRARQRMMAAVPKATVVLTNPTHYAVALAYDRTGAGAAPRVVAKGVDAMAAKIRSMAQDHRVPVIANPPMARALYRVELDSEIPAEHYKAVAEIIAYVWRLRERGRGAVQ